MNIKRDSGRPCPIERDLYEFLIPQSAELIVPTLQLSSGGNIPVVALGTWLGHRPKGKVVQVTNDTEQAVIYALEAGYTHIDTAYKYGIEDQVGRALTKKFSEGLKRESIFITTKLWNSYHEREQVIPALRKSLENLNLEYVDLYLIHWPIAMFENDTLLDNVDFLDTWRGMIDAKKLGLTKSIGISNFNQEQIQRIIDSGLEKPSALQIELNLNLQQPELFKFCRENDIVVMAYTPFGSLFPSKAQPDAPPPRIDDERLVSIAQKYNKTVPQVALRFLIELGAVVLPKSVHKERIEQNIQLFDFSLTPEEFNLLKSFDTGYRTLPQTKWSKHPDYPFQLA
ncbi:aldo-keto reductase AKR2E4-like isoform X1 [Bombyx mori]|uniref:Aldo-keto reductase n=1 Tax=Bombyx mori TaxID=7091 RepID=H9IVS0_BOMMO|nr:aldo-keto reductase AKR2E4-like isoform X1 [Bombyx mori]BBD35022.1 aldo-keto reductase [Bombyx mori]